ncbi:hypothetical protein [Streptomyces sp. NPDC001568]|uniref:hypothetical protein n=1 Tax=Streptomyces sp. NPDC001568 TaxID=3364588 RepID=UPI0036BBADC5
MSADTRLLPLAATATTTGGGRGGWPARCGSPVAPGKDDITVHAAALSSYAILAILPSWD